MKQYEISLLTDRGIVGEKSGLNWGLQTGHSRKNEKDFAEAYIRIPSEVIDNCPGLIPHLPNVKSNSGKINRNFNPILVTWDDGTIMEMVFEGIGVKRPSKSMREEDSEYDIYPKQLTSNDGGGYILGEYIRKRLSVSPRKIITLEDLKKYGRETICLKLENNGKYFIDFSN